MSFRNILKLCSIDFCGLPYTEAVTPAQHLLAWFTPERRRLINASAVDRLAKKSVGVFSKFLKGNRYMTFERSGVAAYYPVLHLIGYLPPPELWQPKQPEQPPSSNLREWFTPERRALVNMKQLDLMSERPVGVLSRYLNGETHMTFKIVGPTGYYPMLALLGFVPPLST